jgi:hypothetical protein
MNLIKSSAPLLVLAMPVKGLTHAKLLGNFTTF